MAQFVGNKTSGFRKPFIVCYYNEPFYQLCSGHFSKHHAKHKQLFRLVDYSCFALLCLVSFTIFLSLSNAHKFTLKDICFLCESEHTLRMVSQPITTEQSPQSIIYATQQTVM